MLNTQLHLFTASRPSFILLIVIELLRESPLQYNNHSSKQACDHAIIYRFALQSCTITRCLRFVLSFEISKTAAAKVSHLISTLRHHQRVLRFKKFFRLTLHYCGRARNCLFVYYMLLLHALVSHSR